MGIIAAIIVGVMVVNNPNTINQKLAASLVETSPLPEEPLEPILTDEELAELQVILEEQEELNEGEYFVSTTVPGATLEPVLSKASCYCNCRVFDGTSIKHLLCDPDYIEPILNNLGQKTGYYTCIRSNNIGDSQESTTWQLYCKKPAPGTSPGPKECTPTTADDPNGAPATEAQCGKIKIKDGKPIEDPPGAFSSITSKDGACKGYKLGRVVKLKSGKEIQLVITKGGPVDGVKTRCNWQQIRELKSTPKPSIKPSPTPSTSSSPSPSSTPIF